MKMEAGEIRERVAPMLRYALPEGAYEQLARYVELLYRWNARMNLTAVRDPAVLVGLHIAECLRAVQLVPEGVSTVLDYGSGAGLPGIPMGIARPELAVALAESQVKKASFLREAVRELALGGASVISDRVEDLPGTQMFDLVTVRAVDRMGRALSNAALRVKAGGTCMVLTSAGETALIENTLPGLSWRVERIPATEQRVILLGSLDSR